MPGAKIGASGHLNLPSVEKLYLLHNANTVDKENAPRLAAEPRGAFSTLVTLG